MKIEGKLFKYPMMINEIIIQGQAIMFHNHNEVGAGYIYGRKLQEAASEDVVIAINEKDYKLLSTLDVFEMNVKDNVIKIKANKIKATLANMVDFKKINVSLKEMKPLKVNLSDLRDAVRFTGTDMAKIQGTGVNVFPQKIIASDSYGIYEDAKETGAEVIINIPREAFKFIPKDAEKVNISYKDGLVDFEFNGIHYYSNLINVHINEKLAIKKDFTNQFKINKSQLISDLQLIQQYDKWVDINVLDGKLILTGKTEIEDIVIEENISMVEYKNDILRLYDVQKLINLLSVPKDTDIDLMIFEEGNQANIYVEDGSRLCMLLGSAGRTAGGK